MSDEPFLVKTARSVSYEFCDSLNIGAFWNWGFPSFCLCLFVVCIVLEGQRTVLLLKELEAENFSMS